MDFYKAISTTHPVEFMPTTFAPDGTPDVPLEFCPALVMTFTALKEGTIFNIAHVISPEKGREVWLYPEGDDFALATCETLSRETKPNGN